MSDTRDIEDYLHRTDTETAANADKPKFQYVRTIILDGGTGPDDCKLAPGEVTSFHTDDRGCSVVDVYLDEYAVHPAVHGARFEQPDVIDMADRVRALREKLQKRAPGKPIVVDMEARLSLLPEPVQAKLRARCPNPQNWIFTWLAKPLIPKMVGKFSFIKITIPTTNVNHTALYKDASLSENFRGGAFAAMYKTDSDQYKKYERDSREHDEVICRAVEVMDLKVRFQERRTRKSTTRYAVIYAECRTEDTETRETIRRQLQEFARKYQRVPSQILVEVCTQL